VNSGGKEKNRNQWEHVFHGVPPLTGGVLFYHDTVDSLTEIKAGRIFPAAKEIFYSGYLYFIF